MFCTSCGQSLMTDAVFCDGCGARVESAEPVSAAHEVHAVDSLTPASTPQSQRFETRPLLSGALLLPDGRTLELPLEGALRIGREEPQRRIDLDLTPFDPKFHTSRQHAEIQARFGEYVLQDLGSRNGTTLNGKRLAQQEEALLQPGDRIQFATVTVTFELR
ncbi:FHA domain-containing protein [Tumebacillus flagellatus]|uniref:FHA domain-containing protein n=1 Tax=Tumebacillus flagellatus TaxID=1157490 RepID=A0A074LNB4_9BACL|nr:FHA domain-containing protein [Tumebacillus flagellatus]KEO81338.1 hypothetical protein EL26_21105 [Tumebacillus flagellatus]